MQFPPVTLSKTPWLACIPVSDGRARGFALALTCSVGKAIISTNEENYVFDEQGFSIGEHQYEYNRAYVEDSSDKSKALVEFIKNNY